MILRFFCTIQYDTAYYCTIQHHTAAHTCTHGMCLDELMMYQLDSICDSQETPECYAECLQGEVLLKILQVDCT